jgi:hypothetical protein
MTEKLGAIHQSLLGKNELIRAEINFVWASEKQPSDPKQ